MMATAMESKIVEEFLELDITVKDSVLDRLSDLSREYNIDPTNLCAEWVAFSQQHGCCELESENLEKFDSTLRVKSRKTPVSRRTVSKTRGGGPKMYTKDDLGNMFGDDDLIGQYATPEDSQKLKSQKRTVEQTTPTTPANKIRHTHNGATPITSRPHPASNGATPTQSCPGQAPKGNGTPTTPFRYSAENGTPAGKYSQRTVSGRVTASLNDCTVPTSWRGTVHDVVVKQLGEFTLKESEQYMFQKVTEKAYALIDRIDSFGRMICAHNRLEEPLSLTQPSLEQAVYTGQIVCEGEGHLNARSCLLEGPIGKTSVKKGTCVKMEIPDSVACSLFPGQVIAVEGINNYHGMLIPSRIYDEGVFPPLPVREEAVKGFTMVAAAGPFTTSESLDMEPLRDLLELVRRDGPDVLVLLGPFVDASHQHIKDCNLPDDMTFTDFFKHYVLKPINDTCRGRTKVILIPSQRDIHHPSSVYPQPPFPLSSRDDHSPVSFSDPSSFSLNGVCLGLTSTDVLFHLSARTMFRGPVGDRMAKIASHILKQRCYYPLLPAFRRDDHGSASRSSDPTASREIPSTPNSTVSSSNQTRLLVAIETEEDTTEVNINLIDAFENGHALLPVRPDILLLPSDLKPFIKVLSGCICVNPGRLTKRTSGGTYMKAIVPDMPLSTKTDFSADIGVQIVHI